MTAPFPAHRQQHGQVGCLYHSTYALTGEESLLVHAEDPSAARFYVRLAELGLMAFTLWCADPPHPCTPASFWERLRERFTQDNVTEQRHAPLLVSIPGATEGWLHQVALLIPAHPDEDTAHVSDSNFPEPLSTSWAAFLQSQYACAHRVEMLGPLALDAYPQGGTV